MKKFNLIRENKGNQMVVSVFMGEDENDPKMIAEFRSYVELWLSGYSNGEQIRDENFPSNTTFIYDGWVFYLEQAE